MNVALSSPRHVCNNGIIMITCVLFCLTRISTCTHPLPSSSVMPSVFFLYFYSTSNLSRLIFSANVGLHNKDNLRVEFMHGLVINWPKPTFSEKTSAEMRTRWCCTHSKLVERDMRQGTHLFNIKYAEQVNITYANKQPPTKSLW